MSINKKYNEIEDYVFEKVSVVVMYWIRKKKFKKHKYHFKKLVRKIELFGFIAICVIQSAWEYSQNHSIAVLIISSSLIVISTLVWIPMLRYDDRKIEWHDVLFQNRKHPLIYNIVKKTNEEKWERDRSFRKTLLVMDIVFFILQCSIQSPFAVFPIFSLITSYIDYVFDFDEPEYKEAPKELTEIMKEQVRDILTIKRPSFI